MEALRLMAIKSQNTVRKSHCGRIALLYQLFLTFFLHKLAAAPKSVNDSCCEALIELQRSIFECGVAARDRFNILVDGALAFTDTGTAVLEAGETGKASGGGP